MRKLLITLVVLAGLLVVADRVAAYVATRQLAGRVQTAEGLAERPDVTIHGFPFLTQVVGGRYDGIDLTARGITSNGVRIAAVRVHTEGVHVRLADALGGRIEQVPVDRGSGSVDIDYAALNALAKKYAGSLVSLSSAGGARLRVTGMVSASGLSTGVGADAVVTASADTLHVVPLPQALDGVPSALRSQARQLLTIDLPLPSLPFGLHLTSGTVTDAGVTAAAAGSAIVIPVGRSG